MLSRIRSAGGRLAVMTNLHKACAVYAVTVIVYRIALGLSVQLAEAAPFGINRGITSFLLILSGLGEDLVLPVIVYALVFTALIIRPTAASSKSRAIWQISALSALLFWNAMILGSHFNLLFTMNSGFTWSIFMEFFTILSLRDFLTLMTARDYVAVLLPLFIYAALLLWRPAWQLRLRRAALLLAGSALILSFSVLTAQTKFADELRMNPHVFFLRDAGRNIAAARETRPLKTGHAASVALADPVFTEATEIPPVPARAERSANIVVIILESTATEYIFDTTKYAGGKMPMPYLYSLAQKSLWATRHFASNNSSPRSIFSVFSGLYESPETRFFSMEKKLQLPHLIDYIGKGYKHFLVTPADLDWYFPKAWFRNRGFTELSDFHKLKQIPEYKAGPTAVRDEFKTVEFFTDQIKFSPKPYLGVYYSFVGHWPYPDIGADYRLIKPQSSRDRYINNLFAQDKLIEKIIRALEESGQIENTAVVIVGDHGEAFYQHPGNRVHSAESYNENIAAPLIIYAPGLTKARRIDVPTVHADIVPTLLDLLGIRYESERFQGESVLRNSMKRSYVFTFGNENTITAVSPSLSKMQILRASSSCRHFDLVQDPAEQKNLSCDQQSRQYRALEAFLKTQPGLLKGYNELCLSGGCQ